VWQIIVLAGVGLVFAFAVVMLFRKARRADEGDRVAQSVVTRINAEYRDPQ
jgi:hypothetical protein